MKSLRLVITIALSGIFFSCTSSSSNSTGSEPVESGVLVPLVPYNVWVYDKVEFTPTGSIKKETTDSVQILPDSKLNSATGITWYDFNHELRSANLADPNFPGLWRVNDDLIYPQLWFKYPAKVGESFRWGPIRQTLAFPTSQKPDSTVNLLGNFVVVAKNVLIPTRDGGNYSCYQYKSEYNDARNVTYLETIEYFAPNVGEIMKEEYVRDVTNSLKLATRSKLISKHLH